MRELFPVVGIWFWWIAAGVLLFMELLAPGVFLMWLALAAASVGITDYFIDLSWQLELLAFAGFSLVFVYLALGPIAGIIGIPYTLLVGDISRLYRVAMWITNAGVRAAGIKIEMHGLENVPAGRNISAIINFSPGVSDSRRPLEIAVSAWSIVTVGATLCTVTD
jgi:hypothetical protein